MNRLLLKAAKPTRFKTPVLMRLSCGKTRPPRPREKPALYCPGACLSITARRIIRSGSEVRGLRFSSSGKKAMLSLCIPRLQLTAASGGNPPAPLNILDFITDFSGSTMTNPQRILQDGYDYFVNGTEISEYITATLDKNDVLVLKFGSPLNLKKISILCEGYKLVEAKPWEFSGWFYHPDGSYQAKASPKVYQNFLHTFEWVLDSEYGNNVDHMSLSLQGYTNYSGNLKIYGIYFEAEE
nr:MAG TPA: hypothetical protein [Caudoviricetes sp.]